MSSSRSWPRAVVFDLDGTLVDSVGDLADALNHLMAKQGMGAFPLDEVRRMVGGGVRILLGRAYRARGLRLDDREGESLAAEFLRYYRPRATRTTALYPGAAELIEQLARAGVKLGICTNKPTDITLDILDAFGLRKRFSAVTGLSDALPRKPDPAMLNETLRMLYVKHSDAVMVGDSAADVETARAAGLPVILVGFGYTDRPAEQLGADFVIGALADAPAALARLRPA